MVSPTLALPAPSSAVKPRPTHFYFLDGLRGLASLWVVFFHISAASVPVLAAALPQPLRLLLFEKGSLGVAIFFVLSGFVISYSLRQVKIDRAYVQNFTLRRWVRLSPPYYASMVAAIAIAALAAQVKGEPLALPSLPSLFAHLLYLQDVLGLGHINEVYWTLCLEMQFYLLFCGLLWLAQFWSQRWPISPSPKAKPHRRSNFIGAPASSFFASAASLPPSARCSLKPRCAPCGLSTKFMPFCSEPLPTGAGSSASLR